MNMQANSNCGSRPTNLIPWVSLACILKWPCSNIATQPLGRTDSGWDKGSEVAEPLRRVASRVAVFAAFLRGNLAALMPICRRSETGHEGCVACVKLFSAHATQAVYTRCWHAIHRPSFCVAFFGGHLGAVSFWQQPYCNSRAVT